VSRQLNEYVLSGSIPKSAIEPYDIVDKVAEEVLRHPELKPESMDDRTWCSSLAFQHTRRAIRRCAEEANVSVPVDLESAPEPAPAGEDDLEPEEFALNLLQSQLEPEETTLADLIPDPGAEPPDAEIGRMDMLAALRRLSRRWPKTDREVFQLHFLEGMSIDDVAHAFACERSAVMAAVSRLRARLRTLLAEWEGIQDFTEPSSARTESYEKHLRSLTAEAVVAASKGRND
jgi:RNA polymerase sigma factor (sigma-70 family)